VILLGSRLERREDGRSRAGAAYAERSTGELVLGPPKSKAARRIVGIPSSIPTVREHLSLFVSLEAEALIFPGVKGGPLRRSNFNKMAAWPHAVRATGAEGLHFHDLRHTGNHFAAASGASLKDLMARMGHDSERAAVIYQYEARGPTWSSRARSTPTSRPPKPARASTATARRKRNSSQLMGLFELDGARHGLSLTG
jgi:hypothetical protein